MGGVTWLSKPTPNSGPWAVARSIQGAASASHETSVTTRLKNDRDHEEDHDRDCGVEEDQPEGQALDDPEPHEQREPSEVAGHDAGERVRGTTKQCRQGRDGDRDDHGREPHEQGGDRLGSHDAQPSGFSAKVVSEVRCVHQISIVSMHAEALDVVARERPDVVLMDIRMPVLNGLEATEQLLALPDPPAVVVLTTFDADEHVVRALAAGAAGFLLKDTPPDRIVEAVRRVAAGDPMLSPSVTRQLIERVRQSSEQPVDARGLSNADIAAELYLSVPTVETHISRLFTKLSVENRVQIASCVHWARLH